MNRSFIKARSLVRSLLLALSAALLLTTAGCALLPLATLSTLLGMAGTAATTGPEVYDMGKLDTAFMANYDQCRLAVLAAVDDLHLHILRDREISTRDQKWEFQVQDERKSKIEITVHDRRSPTFCLCRVDVGIFGSEPTAKLVMHRIESHLPPSAPAASTQPAQ